MTQMKLVPDGGAREAPRTVGECTCNGRGWLQTSEGWPTRCPGCNWVSPRHQRLAGDLRAHTKELALRGGPPTKEEEKIADAIRARAFYALWVTELKEAIERELKNPDEGCTCSSHMCVCHEEDL